MDTRNVEYSSPIDVVAIEALGVTVVDIPLVAAAAQRPPVHAVQPEVAGDGSCVNGSGEKECLLDADALCRVLVTLGS